MVLRAIMDEASADSVLAGIKRKPNAITEVLSQSLTYDLGKDMSLSAELNAQTDAKVNFCD